MGGTLVIVAMITQPVTAQVPALNLFGIARLDAAPAANATVAWFVNGTAIGGAVRTDSAGRFSFDAQPIDRTTIGRTIVVFINDSKASPTFDVRAGDAGASRRFDVSASRGEGHRLLPHDPVPADGSRDVPPTLTLGWQAGNASTIRRFRVDILHDGAWTPEPSDDPARPSLRLSLARETAYSWRVVVNDSSNHTYAGPAWTFRTAGATPPATTLSTTGTPGSDGWLRSEATVTLTCSPAPGGACARTEFGVDGAALARYTGPFVVKGDGRHVVEHRSVGEDGASEPANRAIVAIDSTPPVPAYLLEGIAGSAGYHRSAITVTLRATDATSGLASQDYRLPRTEASRRPYSVPFALADDGVTAIEAWATDVAGNSVNVSFDVRIDRRPPSLDLRLACDTPGTSGWCRTASYGYTASAADELSGLTAFSCTVDGAATPCDSGNVTGERTHTVVATAADAAGNVMTAVAVLGIDSGPPLTTVRLTCATPSPLSEAWCRDGSFEYEATASDDVSGVTTTNCTTDGASAPCKGIVTGPGRHAVTLVTTDGAGNPASVVVNLGIDTDAPACRATYSGAAGDGGWFRSDVTLDLEATDPVSGVHSLTYSVDGLAHRPYPPTFPERISGDGTHVVSCRATDAAGNTADVELPAVMIDTVAPEACSMTYSTTPGPRGWYRTPGTMALAPADATSGVASTTYAIDGAAARLYDAPFIVAGEGSHQVTCHVADRAGNAGTFHSADLPIDTQPPTACTREFSGTEGARGWFVTSGSLSLRGSDATSGAAEIAYAIDGGPLLAYTEPVPIAGDGVRDVACRVTDAAGNDATFALPSIYIDTMPPDRCLPTHSGTPAERGWWRGAVSTTLAFSDTTSGATNASMIVDGHALPSSSGAYGIVGDGIHTLSCRVTDVAGNSAEIALDPVKIDTTPPTVSISSPIAGAILGPVLGEILVAAADSASAPNVSASIGTAPWETMEPTATAFAQAWDRAPMAGATQLVTIRARAVDESGLETLSVPVTVTIDGLPPTADAGPDASGIVRTLIRFNASSSTDDTGIVSYEWIFGDGSTAIGGVVDHAFEVGGVYAVTLTVMDAAANTARDTLIVTIDAPPVWPAGSALRITAIGESNVTLRWTAASDEGGIAAYRIYRNGQLIDLLTGEARSYGDRNLTPDSAYTYGIDAGDSSDQWTPGPRTSLVTAARSGGAPPRWPEGAALTATRTGPEDAELSWTPATLGSAVASYWIFDDSTRPPSYLGPAHSTAHRLTGLSANTSYRLRVAAVGFDGSWLPGGPRAELGPVMPPSPPPVPPAPTSPSPEEPAAFPAIPSGTMEPPIEPRPAPEVLPPPPVHLTATAIDDVTVLLEWRSPTGGNVTGFLVLQNGTPLVTLGADRTSLLVDGLTASTDYEFAVRATNVAGASVDAASISIRTTAAPPTAPTALPVTQAPDAPSEAARGTPAPTAISATIAVVAIASLARARRRM